MKRLSIFPYISNLLVAHLMDLMHIVNNVTFSLYQFTTNKELDGDIVRNDLK